MSSVSIGSVELADLDAAVTLFDAQLREHDIVTPVGDLRSVVRAVLDDPSHGFLLLAWTEDAPVGVAYVASHLSLEHGGFIGWLEELYVSPRWRNAGIGRRLLAEVILRAQKLNWRGLELEVVAGHERVVPLYLRHGFRQLSRNRFSRILR